MPHFSHESITPVYDSNQCIMVINGYSRVVTLASLVVHYAHMDLFHSIIVSWGHQDGPPSFLRDLPYAHGLGHKVMLRKEPNDDLNLRFTVPASVDDDSCVFVADDDIYVTERDVLLMYATWKAHKNQIVGAFPRSHSSSAEGYVYQTKLDKEYSIILTKFMILSAELIRHYSSSPTMSEVRSHVRANNNCEDIAINMMVTALSGLPPVYVSIPEKIDFGTRKGLYTRKDHMDVRSSCIDYFAAHGGTLIRSSISIESFREDSYEKGTTESFKHLTEYTDHRKQVSMALSKELSFA